MIVLVAVIAGVLGLAIGSFLNVVVYRVPAGRSLSQPPSACPHCGHPIRWYDNVPVVSWLVLRGRCRDCGAPISIRYPLIEAGTAVAFALVACCFAPGGWLAPVAMAVPGSLAQWLVLLADLWLVAASIALAVIDIEVRRLPTPIVLPTIVVVGVLLVAAALLDGDLGALLRVLVSGAALCAFYLLLAIISRGGMGLGDVRLAAALGLALGWVGWAALVVGALAAFVFGGLFGIVLIVIGRARRRTAIPFGPWMLAGAWVGLVAGPAIWSWYSVTIGLV